MRKGDKLRIVDYLEHMLQAIQRINNYTGDMVEHIFLGNELVQDAVIRNTIQKDLPQLEQAIQIIYQNIK